MLEKSALQNKFPAWSDPVPTKTNIVSRIGLCFMSLCVCFNCPLTGCSSLRCLIVSHWNNNVEFAQKLVSDRGVETSSRDLTCPNQFAGKSGVATQPNPAHPCPHHRTRCKRLYITISGVYLKQKHQTQRPSSLFWTGTQQVMSID